MKSYQLTLLFAFVPILIYAQDKTLEKVVTINANTFTVDETFPFDRPFWLKIELKENPNIEDIRIYQLTNKGDKKYPTSLARYEARSMMKTECVQKSNGLFGTKQLLLNNSNNLFGLKESVLHEKVNLVDKSLYDIKPRDIKPKNVDKNALDFGLKIKEESIKSYKDDASGKYVLLIRVYPLRSRQKYGLKIEYKRPNEELHKLVKNNFYMPRTGRKQEVVAPTEDINDNQTLKFWAQPFTATNIETDSVRFDFKAFIENETKDYKPVEKTTENEWTVAFELLIKPADHKVNDAAIAASVEQLFKSMKDSLWILSNDEDWKKVGQWLALFSTESLLNEMINGLVVLDDFHRKTDTTDIYGRKANMTRNIALMDALVLQFESRKHDLIDQKNKIDALLQLRNKMINTATTFNEKLKAFAALEAETVKKFNEENRSKGKTFNGVIRTDGTSEILSFEQRGKLRLTPDFGLITYYEQLATTNYPGVRPYLGFHLNFKYLEKDIPFRMIPNKSLLHYLSLNFGSTIGSIAIENQRYDLLQSIKSSLIMGMSVRCANAWRLTFGTMMFLKEDPNPTVSTRSVAFTPMAGLSIDLDLREQFNGFTNFFGKK